MNLLRYLVWVSLLYTAPSTRSHLYVLLRSFTRTTELFATRLALTSLLTRILSESIIFQRDPDEVHLWLSSLPTTRRLSAKSPDGAPLTDEGESVVVFLDDCVQRCSKTPYRYIEEMQTYSQYSTSHKLPSPLLMTILEQLQAKLSGKLLSASDVLAVATFFRKLLYQLSSSQQDLEFLKTVAAKLDVILLPEALFPEYPVLTAGIRREVSILHRCLNHLPIPSSLELCGATSSRILNFISQIEALPTRQSICCLLFSH